MVVRQDVERQLADEFLRQLDLLVGLEVHERVLAALLEQVLHRTSVEVDLLDFLTGAEALLDDRAVVQVTNRHLDERAEVAGGPVLELGDQVQLVVKLDAHVGTQVGRLHAECSFGGGGRRIARRPIPAGRVHAAIRVAVSREMHSDAPDLREPANSGGRTTGVQQGAAAGNKGPEAWEGLRRGGQGAGRQRATRASGWKTVEKYPERNTPKEIPPSL